MSEDTFFDRLERKIQEQYLALKLEKQMSKSEIMENYARGAQFLSSGRDGFMREYIGLPADRVVSCEGIAERVAAVMELSV